MNTAFVLFWLLTFAQLPFAWLDTDQAATHTQSSAAEEEADGAAGMDPIG
jgi:hypothetical protein